MTNYRTIIRAELNNNKVASIPAKKYSRSRAQAKRVRTYTSTTASAEWNNAIDVRDNVEKVGYGNNVVKQVNYSDDLSQFMIV